MASLQSDAQADVADHTLPPLALVHLARIQRRNRRGEPCCDGSLGLPRSYTTAYRLCNSEGDGRRRGSTSTCLAMSLQRQFSALGMKLCEDAVYAALVVATNPPSASWEAAAGSFASIEGFVPSTIAWCSVMRACLPMARSVWKSKVWLWIDVRVAKRRAHFSISAPMARLLLGRYCAGAKVLDAYSYAGGFPAASAASRCGRSHRCRYLAASAQAVY